MIISTKSQECFMRGYNGVSVLFGLCEWQRVPLPSTGPLPINAHNSRNSKFWQGESTIENAWTALENGPRVSEPKGMTTLIFIRVTSKPSWTCVSLRQSTETL